MKKNLSLLLILISTQLVISCSTLNVDETRKGYYSDNNQLKIKVNDLHRSSKIQNSEESQTSYSKPISCLSTYLAEQQFSNAKIQFKPTQQDLTDLENAKTELEQMKNKLDFLIFNFSKNVFKSDEKLKKHKLNNSDIKFLASASVENKKFEKEIEELREKIAEQEQKIKNSENEINSYESNALKALNKYQQGQNWLSYSVSPIYDKTGKVFSENSTAISDMVAHALIYNNAIQYKDTPFNADWSFSRANIESAGTTKSIGSAIKADRYISGALVQYDEGSPFANLSSIENINFSIDPVDISKGSKIITVGLTLRAMNSNGEVVFEGTNEISKNHLNDNEVKLNFNKFVGYSPASVYVQNTFFAKDIGMNLFEIKGDRNYGFDFSVNTSDPKTYAVRELIDRAVFELLLKSLSNSTSEKYPMGLKQTAEDKCSPNFSQLEKNIREKYTKTEKNPKEL